MIICSRSHHSPKRKAIKDAVDYVFKSVRAIDEQAKPIVFKRNLKSMDTESWIDQLVENDARKQYSYGKRRVVLRHEWISFSPADSVHLTRDIIRDLGKAYLDMRSPNSLSAGGFHLEENEGGNYHVHFIISACDKNGNSTSISKRAFEDFKHSFQQLQIERYPFLESVVDHKKKVK